MSRVLVTGGSGFVGSHAILRLIVDGHSVRSTVRRPERAAALRERLGEAGCSPDDVTIVAADLLGDEGWAEAVGGCDYVLHVASPFPAAQPKDANELIVPARDGTLRVLRAARDAGVERVVLTSSFAAVGYGHPPRDEPFTEADWSDTSADLPPYIRSKIAAEQAAWRFIEEEGGGLELSVINPVGIFGPVLGRDYSSSIAIVERMLSGKLPACPRVYFGVVDVRDVVDLHLRAMVSAEAAGERFIAVAGDSLSMLDVATILRERLGEAASEAPTRELPDWVVRVASLFNRELRPIAASLGELRRASNAKARRQLEWTPRANEAVIEATGASLLRLGLAP
ncbi:SDR family oxidoreductase [Enhygromyxa salina]|uniref:UDP-glucose 4-epimerase n=1 Tax=Enhygromyxa salina TaxID=215803 RepID=A0A2S9YAJ2_9BACT|nr:aldehyde reductase [Enhygromyxa salina]PRQ02082.1 UDP-glucose 4-epimerase [Enhygromyxa salina]